MQVHDRSRSHDKGACHRLMAGMALLLLAVSAIGGLLALPSGGGPVALKTVGGASAPVLAIDDAGRMLALLRSAAITKSSRAPTVALGAFGPDDHRLGVALLPVSAPYVDAARHMGGRDRTPAHPAASGQLTRRTPTGPPVDISFAV